RCLATTTRTANDQRSGHPREVRGSQVNGSGWATECRRDWVHELQGDIHRLEREIRIHHVRWYCEMDLLKVPSRMKRRESAPTAVEHVCNRRGRGRGLPTDDLQAPGL